MPSRRRHYQHANTDPQQRAQPGAQGAALIALPERSGPQPQPTMPFEDTASLTMVPPGAGDLG